MTDRDKLLKKNNLGSLEIDKEIRKKRPNNEEIAILRKTLHAVIHGQPIPTEFDEYYAEAEGVKASVKERLNPKE
jgi:hypothetical protein